MSLELFAVQNPHDDPALNEVAQEIRRLDPSGARWAAVVRHTYDMIYNGQETGRYRWDQLMKTEKTHFGTLFEINAQREFGFDGGDATDYRIAGHQVDAKWSQKMGAWMLPPEVFGELALVATGDDSRSTWSLGLVRVTEEARRTGHNRDKKSQLNDVGRKRITWLWRDAELRPNVLLQLPRATVDHIFDHRSGAERTNRLFVAAEGRICHRNAVATVSRQLDAQRRVRYDKRSPRNGARSALQPDGYIILSGMYHRELACDLDVPVPLQDEYVSVRVVPDRLGVRIGDGRWRRAQAGEKTVIKAPVVLDKKSTNNNEEDSATE
ncbi:NaeI family type II restriction endonuclease [Gordonia amicalis]|uniref:NaeI family type II restriction endonuclease n=1 Tax=Gordonia amicalis TaxID=89053 RepID=UPI0029553D7D|nr:NaeI family type II restriction endonuclease [Gordonia amicalis]MDV7102050.1 NaeI family type II restriction endonuclease [Gordonia amicalis]